MFKKNQSSVTRAMPFTTVLDIDHITIALSSVSNAQLYYIYIYII